MLSTPAQSQDSSIRLNCLIEGESTVFTVTMRRDRVVGELKEEIKMERALDTLKDIGPHILELWKPKDSSPIAVTPVDTLAGRIIESMGDDPSNFADNLVPTYRLSRIFSNKPSNDHVHIIAKVPATVARIRPTVTHTAPPFSTLQLFCHVRNDDHMHAFEVKIRMEETVADLKKMIKKEKFKTFRDVAAHSLILWNVNIPCDEDLNETVNKLGLVDKKALLPVIRMSEIFPKQPEDEHIHVVVKELPITIPQKRKLSEPSTAPFSTLQLFCYVRNDDHMHAFEVKIGMEETVAALKKVIKKKMKPDSDHVCADTLVLWNVNIPYDEDLNETVNKLGLVDKKALLPVIRMSKIFPKQLEDEHIHVVVKELPITIPQKRKLSEPSENVLTRLKRSKLATFSPSETAKLATYKSLQGDPSEKIFDGRPKPDADIPPVELLYEGFAHFLDIMNGHKNVPGLADVDLQELHKHVDNLASEMTGYFINKDDRRDEALNHLNKIFSARKGIKIPRFHASPIGPVRTDGHYTELHGLEAMVVNFENSLTGIKSFPHIELVGYAAHLAATRKQEVEDQLYLRWRIPFVGLTIIGYYITLYAIIAIDHQFQISQLTYPLSCIEHQGECRMLLYSAFTAASVLQARILQDIEKHLKTPPAVIPVQARRFPEVSKLRQYPPSGGDYFSFEIQAFFPDRQLDRYLYVAKTPDERRILIKFSQQYSIELHAFCARSGHAPQIFAFEQLPGGWCAVAMEYIESSLPITDPSLPSAHLQRCAEDLQRLMDDFHSKGFVHGDLRIANLLCNGDSAMLLDYDWGGKDGEAFYPTLNLNDELLQGRASYDRRITKEDDKRVLKNTLAKLVNRDM